MATEKRQRQKEGHRLQKEELRKWEQRRRSRRRLLTWGGVIAAAAVVLFGYSALTGDDGEDAAAPTTTLAPTECPPAGGVDQPVLAFNGPPPTCIDPTKQYTAVFDTSEGEIRVDLDTENTPETVNNFVVLARYGYYDDTPVFRTDPSIGIIQAGGADATSNPGYTIPDEGSGYIYEPGQIVMARNSSPDSASAQFFLVADDAASNLDGDGSYVVFGNTDDAGLGVVQDILALHEADPTSNLGGAPSRPVTINSVTIEAS